MATASDPINVGIAGLGRAGWGIHATALQALPDKYRIVAVCDPGSDRLAEARDKLGCTGYAEFLDLTNDEEVELVVVAMPSQLHAGLTVTALRAGKHVIVEKPFATDLASADHMISAARAAGCLLTGSQNYRYLADFLKIREVLASGKLGEILSIRIDWHWFRRRWDWQTLREFGGGSLNNDGSHAIDQALLLLGDVEPEVTCHMRRTPLSSGDAEDHVKVLLSAPGAPIIDLEFSNACAYPQDMWLIMGTQGGLTGSHTQIRWKYLDPRLLPARPVSRVPTPDRSYNREELPWIEETCDLSRDGYGPSSIRLYDDLFASIRHGAPLAITVESIRRQIAVLNTCRELGAF